MKKPTIEELKAMLSPEDISELVNEVRLLGAKRPQQIIEAAFHRLPDSWGTILPTKSPETPLGLTMERQSIMSAIIGTSKAIMDEMRDAGKDGAVKGVR